MQIKLSNYVPLIRHAIAQLKVSIGLLKGIKYATITLLIHCLVYYSLHKTVSTQMISSFLQSRTEKLDQKIKDHLFEGVKHLENKFFNGAMIEFDKAMELDPQKVYPLLKEELTAVALGGELESALAIGLNLIKQNGQDYELANQLGNYARELGDIKQANSLYRSSLRVNKNYHLAYYNLAASIAKVDIYDEAVKSALSQFNDISDYIIPEYIGSKNLIEQYSAEIIQRKTDHSKDNLQELSLIYEQKIEKGLPIEALEYEFKIKQLKENLDKVSEDEIISEFKKQIKNDATNEKIHRFNLGLYAIKIKNISLATKTLAKLAPEDFETLELIKAILLDLSGNTKGAIDKLIQLLGKNEFNRYLNVNLGLLYQKNQKSFLSIKYLVKTAYLLNKSGGIYSLTELVKEADKSYEQGKLIKALNFYLIAISEVPTPELWEKIGTIYIDQKKFDDAAGAFKEVLKLDTESAIGHSKLLDIHSYYVNKSEYLIDEHKFKPAVDHLLKALDVLSVPETFKKTANAYKLLNDPVKVKEFMNKWDQVMEEIKAKEDEKLRQKLIIRAKGYLKGKKYNQAVKDLEKAFRMKIDHSVFVQLASLYKALKRTEPLAILEKRWQEMLSHQEKLQKYEKEQERLKSSD